LLKNPNFAPVYNPEIDDDDDSDSRRLSTSCFWKKAYIVDKENGEREARLRIIGEEDSSPSRTNLSFVIASNRNALLVVAYWISVSPENGARCNQILTWIDFPAARNHGS
jgi:hypothetical protein